MRYKLRDGKHDRLTICLAGLEAVGSSPSGVGCGAGSDIRETDRTEGGDRVVNYCELVCKRCLGRARGVLDRGEEVDRLRDLNTHHIQLGSGVRPARVAAHALNSPSRLRFQHGRLIKEELGEKSFSRIAAWDCWHWFWGYGGEAAESKYGRESYLLYDLILEFCEQGFHLFPVIAYLQILPVTLRLTFRHPRCSGEYCPPGGMRVFALRCLRGAPPQCSSIQSSCALAG